MKAKPPRVEHIGEPSPRLVVEAVAAALAMEQGEERERATIARELARLERAAEREAESARHLDELQAQLAGAARLAERATVDQRRAMAALLVGRVLVAREGGTLREGGRLVVRVAWRG